MSGKIILYLDSEIIIYTDNSFREGTITYETKREFITMPYKYSTLTRGLFYVMGTVSYWNKTK